MSSARSAVARVVRQEWTDRGSTPMVDARVGPGRPPRRRSPDGVRGLRLGRSTSTGCARARRTTTAWSPTSASTPSRTAASAGTSPSSRNGSTLLVRYYADLPSRSEPVALLHAHDPSTRPDSWRTSVAVAHCCTSRARTGSSTPCGGCPATTRRPSSPLRWATGFTTSPTATTGWPRGCRPGNERADRRTPGCCACSSRWTGSPARRSTDACSAPVDAAALLDAAAGRLRRAAGGRGGRDRRDRACTSRGSWYDLVPDRRPSRRIGRSRRHRPAHPPPRPRPGHRPARCTPGSRWSLPIVPLEQAVAQVRRGRRRAVLPAAPVTAEAHPRSPTSER